MQNRSSPRLERIREVGAALAAAHIMPAWVTQQVDGLSRRWDELQAEVVSFFYLFHKSRNNVQFRNANELK